MDELVKLVTQKVGIPQEQAKKAVEVVLNFLKEKLPEPLAGQVEAFINGGEIPGDLMKGIGSLFGD